MKKDIHPPYQDVLFIDSNGAQFIIGSCVETTETQVHEGKEYPVYRVSTSSASHPFFTGQKQFVDAEGRVSRFMNRYAQKREKLSKEKEQQQQQEKEKKQAKKAKKKK